MKHVFTFITIIGCLTASYLLYDQYSTTLSAGLFKKSSLRLDAMVPSAIHEIRVQHVGHLLSYNTSHNTPNWVAWELTASHTNGPVERSQKFYADTALPQEYRVDWYEYKGSGYDRGHICPAGDNKYDRQAMHDCFYMSNICPQDSTLNNGAWKKLEETCRVWAKREGRLYIISGPMYSKETPQKIGMSHAVDVPQGFYKVIYSLQPGKEKAIGFCYENSPKAQSMKTCATTVRAIEKQTGIDFFPDLEDRLEKRIEESYNLASWN